MVEEISLPLDALFLCEPSLPRCNAFPHEKCIRENHNPMQMIRHREYNFPFPITPILAKFNGFHQMRPDFRTSQLIDPTRQTIDSDEKRLLSRVKPVRWIMWKLFAQKVHINAQVARAGSARKRKRCPRKKPERFTLDDSSSPHAHAVCVKTAPPFAHIKSPILSCPQIPSTPPRPRPHSIGIHHPSLHTSRSPIPPQTRTTRSQARRSDGR